MKVTIIKDVRFTLADLTVDEIKLIQKGLDQLESQDTGASELSWELETVLREGVKE